MVARWPELKGASQGDCSHEEEASVQCALTFYLVQDPTVKVGLLLNEPYLNKSP